MFGPMASTSNTFDDSQPKYTWWHGLGFAAVLAQGHDKVISRSQEGQISSKEVKITILGLDLIAIFVGVASIQLTWDVYGGWNLARPQHGNITKTPQDVTWSI